MADVKQELPKWHVAREPLPAPKPRPPWRVQLAVNMDDGEITNWRLASFDDLLALLPLLEPAQQEACRQKLVTGGVVKMIRVLEEERDAAIKWAEEEHAAYVDAEACEADARADAELAWSECRKKQVVIDVGKAREDKLRAELAEARRANDVASYNYHKRGEELSELQTELATVAERQREACRAHERAELVRKAQAQAIRWLADPNNAHAHEYDLAHLADRIERCEVTIPEEP